MPPANTAIQPWTAYAAAPYPLPAPAKLNLFLHITGRAATGYHRLQTLFVFIDWQDQLTFRLRRDGLITRQDVHTALAADDLCVRAARLLQQTTLCPLGVDILLEKHIPQAAGLGGGSSDAATTLVALNRLWGLHLSPQQLHQIGQKLGADVTFFLQADNAWAEGYGEQLTPLAHFPAMPYVVLKPTQGVLTKTLFLHPDLPRDKKNITIPSFAGDADTARRQFWTLFRTAAHTDEVLFENSMQSLAVALCPGIGQALTLLQTASLAARMTGSGSAVFAPLPVDGNANLQYWQQRIAPHLAKGMRCRICQGLSKHPLAPWMSA